MNFLQASALRAHEARLVAASPDPAACELTLVRTAGQHLALRLAALLREMRLPPSAGILFFAGKGNNGADALSAASFLHDSAHRVAVLTTAPFPAEGAPATTPSEILLAAVRDRGIPCFSLPDAVSWSAVSTLDCADCAVWVDALLGTGASGTPREPVASAIRLLDARPPSIPLVSVDIPSGLDPESGAPSPCTARADLTLCMAAPKACLASPASRDAAGTVEVAPLSELAVETLPPAPATPDLIVPHELAPLFPPRQRATHKGTYGRALLIGGAPLYPGAIVLAVEAALRSGAGLVRASTSPAAVSAILARCPDAIARPDLFDPLDFSAHSAILCGPGLGRNAEARRLVSALLRETPAPLVLDADALTLLEGQTDALLSCPAPLLLTPHAAEAASLLRCPVDDVLADRPAAAAELSLRSGATVVLKGDSTLVASPASPLSVNLNGNPGMAVGGSGDVLAGLLVGLLAQGLPPRDAARAAVWLHGAAGDIAARRLGPALRASDLPPLLPAALLSLHRPS